MIKMMMTTNISDSCVLLFQTSLLQEYSVGPVSGGGDEGRGGRGGGEGGIFIAFGLCLYFGGRGGGDGGICSGTNTVLDSYLYCK